MPRRKKLITVPDRKLEQAAGAFTRRVTEARKRELSDRQARNETWWRMFHEQGYTQRRIAEISNAESGLQLDPADPEYVTDDTVEKALKRMLVSS